MAMGQGYITNPDQDHPVAQGARARPGRARRPRLRHQREGAGRGPADVRAHGRRHRAGHVRPRQPGQDADPRRADGEPAQRGGPAPLPAGPTCRRLRRGRAVRLAPLRRGLRDGRLGDGPARRQAHHDPTGRGPHGGGADRARRGPAARGAQQGVRRRARARPGDPQDLRRLWRLGRRDGPHPPPRRGRRHRGNHRLGPRVRRTGRVRGHGAQRRDHGRRQAPAAEPPGHLDRARRRARAGGAARERVPARPDAAREHHAGRPGPAHDDGHPASTSGAGRRPRLARQA